MKIYLDDLRATPDGWTRAYTIEQVQELMRANVVTHMSLDHDLGASYACQKCKDAICDGYDCNCECHQQDTPTGYDLVKWMVATNSWPVYKPLVHSANPVGAKRMREDIDKYFRPPTEE